MKPLHYPQHNANTGNDFRRIQRSQTLTPGEKRDVAARPADHIPAPIFPATLAPLGFRIAPGYHPFGPLRMSKNTQLRPLSSFGKNEIRLRGDGGVRVVEDFQTVKVS